MMPDSIRERVAEVVRDNQQDNFYGDAGQIADALLEAFPQLTEHDRQIAERAWNEGFDSGFYDGQVHPTSDACETVIQNPYRKENDGS